MSEPPPPEQPDPEPEDPSGGAGIPDLEAILRASQGIHASMDESITMMAALHARWRQAWEDTGKFTSDEAFELIRILVAASGGGLRSLD